MFPAVPDTRNDHVTAIQNGVSQHIGTTTERREPLTELYPGNAYRWIFSNTVSCLKNYRRCVPSGDRTVRSEEVIKTRHVIERVRMPDQRGHSLRFPSARSESHARARSCDTPGVPDKKESSRERSISSDNASENTAATYSSTDCPDRRAAVNTADSSSFGNDTVSIPTSQYLTNAHCSRTCPSCSPSQLNNATAQFPCRKPKAPRFLPPERQAIATAIGRIAEAEATGIRSRRPVQANRYRGLACRSWHPHRKRCREREQAAATRAFTTRQTVRQANWPARCSDGTGTATPQRGSRCLRRNPHANQSNLSFSFLLRFNRTVLYLNGVAYVTFYARRGHTRWLHRRVCICRQRDRDAGQLRPWPHRRPAIRTATRGALRPTANYPAGLSLITRLIGNRTRTRTRKRPLRDAIT